MKYKITDLMDLYEDPSCPFPPLDKPLQTKQKSNHKEIREVKQSKHRFDWKQELSIAAALGVMVLGVSGILLLKSHRSQAGSSAGAAPSDALLSSMSADSSVADASEAKNPAETTSNLSLDPYALVEDAFSQSGKNATLEDLDGSPDHRLTVRYSYHIPRIDADTPGAEAINAAIEQNWGEYAREQYALIQQQLPCQCTEIRYETFYSDGILSLVLDERSAPMRWDKCLDVYHYELSTGRQLTSCEMLDRLGISEEDWLSAFRKRFQTAAVEANCLLLSEDPLQKDGKYYCPIQIGGLSYEIPLVIAPDHYGTRGTLQIVAPSLVKLNASDSRYLLLHTAQIDPDCTISLVFPDDSGVAEILGPIFVSPDAVGSDSFSIDESDASIFSSGALQVNLVTENLVGEAFSQSGEDALRGYPEAANPVPDAYSYKIPCLLADTDGARAINEAIEKKWGAYARAQCDQIRQKLPCQTTGINWHASYNDGVLSLFLVGNPLHRLSPELCSEPILDVYFYDVAGGRQLTSPEMLERKGISEEAWRSACRSDSRFAQITESNCNSFLTEAPQLVDGTYVYQVEIDSVTYALPVAFFPVPDTDELLIEVPIIIDETNRDALQLEIDGNLDQYELQGQPPLVAYLTCIMRDLSSN